MSLLELRIELTEDRIKQGKKYFRILTGFFVFMIAIVIFDCYEIHNGLSNSGILIGLGLILANIMWYLCDIYNLRSEIKSERRSLEYMEELVTRQEYVDALQMLKQRERLHAGATEQINDLLRPPNVSRESMQQESVSPEVEKT
jgi:hypothetical protein